MLVIEAKLWAKQVCNLGTIFEASLMEEKPPISILQREAILPVPQMKNDRISSSIRDPKTSNTHNATILLTCLFVTYKDSASCHSHGGIIPLPKIHPPKSPNEEDTYGCQSGY